MTHRGSGPACFVTPHELPDHWDVDGWPWQVLNPFHLLALNAEHRTGEKKTRCGLVVTDKWHRYTYEDVAGEHCFKDHQGVKPPCVRCRKGSHAKTWRRKGSKIGSGAA